MGGRGHHAGNAAQSSPRARGRDDPQPWRGRISNVWTPPEHRRQGHARALVTACLEASRQRGITRVNWGSSAVARGLYEQLGFQTSETQMWQVLPPRSQ
ncbi:GNAT family N-acetyltransferase [Deinococcus sp.]|uniref:GNAT family N-acetyltransferase n=1 Tax=Deinococcus sp. TaxID=47478 RepID=UPI0038D45BB4